MVEKGLWAQQWACSWVPTCHPAWRRGGGADLGPRAGPTTHILSAPSPESQGSSWREGMPACPSGPRQWPVAPPLWRRGGAEVQGPSGPVHSHHPLCRTRGGRAVPVPLLLPPHCSLGHAPPNTQGGEPRDGPAAWGADPGPGWRRPWQVLLGVGEEQGGKLAPALPPRHFQGLVGPRPFLLPLPSLSHLAALHS